MLQPLFLKNLSAYAGDQTQSYTVGHSLVSRKTSSLSTRSGIENEELSSGGESKGNVDVVIKIGVERINI